MWKDFKEFFSSGHTWLGMLLGGELLAFIAFFFGSGMNAKKFGMFAIISLASVVMVILVGREIHDRLQRRGENA